MLLIISMTTNQRCGKMFDDVPDMVVKSIIGTGLALLVAGLVDPSLLDTTVNLGGGLDVLLYPTVWFILGIVGIFWGGYIFFIFVEFLLVVTKRWLDMTVEEMKKNIRWSRRSDVNDLEEGT